MRNIIKSSITLCMFLLGIHSEMATAQAVLTTISLRSLPICTSYIAYGVAVDSDGSIFVVSDCESTRQFYVERIAPSGSWWYADSGSSRVSHSITQTPNGGNIWLSDTKLFVITHIHFTSYTIWEFDAKSGSITGQKTQSGYFFPGGLTGDKDYLYFGLSSWIGYYTCNIGRLRTPVSAQSAVDIMAVNPAYSNCEISAITIAGPNLYAAGIYGPTGGTNVLLVNLPTSWSTYSFKVSATGYAYGISFDATAQRIYVSGLSKDSTYSFSRAVWSFDTNLLLRATLTDSTSAATVYDLFAFGLGNPNDGRLFAGGSIAGENLLMSKQSGEPWTAAGITKELAPVVYGAAFNSKNDELYMVGKAVVGNNVARLYKYSGKKF